MDNGRDTSFARFAFTVITIAIVVIVLGLTGIYYFLRVDTNKGATTSLNIFSNKVKLPPNQAMIYYTKDGRQLVGMPATIGDLDLDLSEKAKRIMNALLQGERSVGLKSVIPEGTTLINLFINDKQVIVNLSAHMVSNLQGGMDAELLAVYAVVNSLLFNLEGIESVQILIESEKLPTLAGQVDISIPLIANSAITRTN